jgi:hypothetical protein
MSLGAGFDTLISFREKAGLSLPVERAASPTGGAGTLVLQSLRSPRDPIMGVAFAKPVDGLHLLSSRCANHVCAADRLCIRVEF